MAGKSTGQWVGTIVGAVVGFFIPGSYVALGAALGGAIGGMIDPPKGPDVVGPRIEDLNVQTSTYGASIPRGYGTRTYTGNLFWLEGDKLKENTKTEEQGGKGGGGSEVTTYTYSATFAIGLAHVVEPGQTVMLKRLWIGDRLVTNNDSDDAGTIISSMVKTTITKIPIYAPKPQTTTSTSVGASYTFYPGTNDQQPDPRMQADKGAANVSGYPGLVYIVFQDLDLTEHYSNTLLRAQVKAELVFGGTATSGTDLVSSFLATTAANEYAINTLRFNGAAAQLTYTVYSDWDASVLRTTSSFTEYGIDYFYSATAAADDPYTPSNFQSNLPIICWYSDIDVTCVCLGRFNYSYRQYLLFGPSGEVLRDSGPVSTITFDYAFSRFIASRGDIYFFGSNLPVALWVSGNNFVLSPATYNANSVGASENYLFLTQLSSGSYTSCTVYKIRRSDLGLEATYTQSVSGVYTVISVIDDDTFYTMSSNKILYRWDSGVVSSGLMTYTGDWSASVRLNVLSDSGAFLATGFTDLVDVFALHAVIPASAAKLRDVVTAECSLVGLQSSDLTLTTLTNSDVRGYAITNAGAVRNALEPLRAAYQFDVTQAGYTIKFVSRGGASVASIPEADLGAMAPNDKSGVLLPVSREMDSQLAHKISIKYLDPDREYDLGEQYAERPGTTSESERSMELAMSLTGTEAAQIADILLSKEWVERSEFGPFVLPPTWLHLEPADVIAVSHRSQAYTLRLTRIEYLPDGRLSCNAVRTAAACYTSTATGEDPITQGQQLIPLRGLTVGELLDIPRIQADQDVLGMAFAMMGPSTGWTGATLAMSDDSGNTWKSAGAMNSAAKIFQASNALSSHYGYSPDYRSILTVTPLTPGAELYDVTEDQFYGMANLAAYGQDGRWEIVSFRNITDNTGTFTVQDFLRGLYGTEWATGLHIAGDMLIMLDRATIGFFGLPSTALGIPRLYRFVTQGSHLDSAEDITDTYEANNLKPLSLVDIRGHRFGVGRSWVIEATRRTRWPVEVFSGTSVPIGETAEAYELDLYTSGFSTLIRTFSGLSSPSAEWTSAMQTTDTGGTANPWVYFRWYQISSVVGRGMVAEGSLYRSLENTSGDGYDDLVTALGPVLYLKMDGNTTTITDSSPSANNGTASASNVTYQQPALFSGETPGYAIKFTAGYVTVSHLSVLNGAYTCCFLMNLDALPVANSYFLHKGDFSSYGNWGHAWGLTTTGYIGVDWYNSGWRSVSAGPKFISAGEKVFVTLVWNGGTTVKVYKNGMLFDTLTLAYPFLNSANPLYINAYKTTGSAVGFTPTNTIDDFVWFNKQLSDGQILALYEET